MRISRERYGALYGPTVGDRLRLADTDLWLEVEEDRCVGGDEAVFGGGKTIRESSCRACTSAAGAPDTVITNVVVLDHWGIVKCDVGIKAGRIVALGKAGNPDVMDGVRPGAGDRPDDRDHRRRGADPDRGRDRRARALHLPADRRRGGRGGDDDADRRRHRAGRGHARDDLHAVAVADPRDAAGDGRAAGQRAAARQGQHGVAGRDARAGAGGRGRLQAARGLGLDAGRDRRLPADRRRDRRAGRDPHGHAQRGRVRRDDAGRDRRADDPRLPHRGRGRRARAGHHHASPAQPNVLPSSTNPTRPHTVNTRRRAPRHADRLPPPQPADPGGPGVRRDRGSAARRSPPRTSCTTWARSR